MVKSDVTEYEPVNARPVKSFFVTMLTRDIKLEDAILDLLDNCIDGILRAKNEDGSEPYKGYWADIKFNRDSFEISDNCGGIPWKLHTYAFRLGRDPNQPADEPGSVGAYGIGMKRAIFKMGMHCLISTRSGADEYEIEISPEWMKKDSDWDLHPAKARKSMKYEGTTIIIGELNPGVADLFSEEKKRFESDLEDMVSEQYAFIIDKGFQVKINGHAVDARPTKLIFDFNDSEQTGLPPIRPYIFRSTTANGVEVYLAVGFTGAIPSQDEALEESESKQRSSEFAGWTILCNDRAVVYCDKSELTGWGEAGIPRYHTQFIAISGIVEFKAANAALLPTTTTKRGVDASLQLYLQIKNKMREGMRIFTDYTNKWKGRADESKEQIEKGTPISFAELKKAGDILQFHGTLGSVPAGDIFRPKLPLPQKDRTKRRISYVKPVGEIKEVSEYFDAMTASPSEVGELCFDFILKEARKG